MSTPCKEDRSQKRCSGCGRILHGTLSQRRGICSICEPRGNIEKVWSRRMKVKDDLLAAYMNEKLHKVPTTLSKLKQVADQRVEVRGIPELVAFLKKKVVIK